MLPTRSLAYSSLIDSLIVRFSKESKIPIITGKCIDYIEKELFIKNTLITPETTLVLGDGVPITKYTDILADNNFCVERLTFARTLTESTIRLFSYLKGCGFDVLDFTLRNNSTPSNYPLSYRMEDTMPFITSWRNCVSEVEWHNTDNRVTVRQLSPVRFHIVSFGDAILEVFLAINNYPDFILLPIFNNERNLTSSSKINFTSYLQPPEIVKKKDRKVVESLIDSVDYDSKSKQKEFVDINEKIHTAIPTMYLRTELCFIKGKAYIISINSLGEKDKYMSPLIIKGYHNMTDVIWEIYIKDMFFNGC